MAYTYQVGLTNDNTDEETNDMVSFIKVATLDGHDNAVKSLKFSCHGKLLASVGLDTCVKVWDIHNSKLHKNLIGHKKEVCDLSWSHDDTLLVSASMDETLIVWDILSGRCLRVLKGYRPGVFSCAFNPNSTLIVSGSAEAVVYVWDVKTGNLIKILKKDAEYGNVIRVCFNINGTRIISATNSGRWFMWDTASDKCLGEVINTSAISAIDLSSRGNAMMISTYEGPLQYWCLSESFHDTNVVEYIAFLNDEKYISELRSSNANDLWFLTKDQDGQTLNVWSVEKDKTLARIKCDFGKIQCVTCHSTRNLIAVASTNKTITVYNMKE